MNEDTKSALGLIPSQWDLIDYNGEIPFMWLAGWVIKQ